MSKTSSSRCDFSRSVTKASGNLNTYFDRSLLKMNTSNSTMNNSIQNSKYSSTGFSVMKTKFWPALKRPYTSAQLTDIREFPPPSRGFQFFNDVNIQSPQNVQLPQEASKRLMAKFAVMINKKKHIDSSESFCRDGVIATPSRPTKRNLKRFHMEKTRQLKQILSP